MTALTFPLMEPPASADEVWRRLARPRPDPVPFEPEEVSDLPEPVRRWLRRALPSGAPPARVAELEMHGSIRLGDKWRPFTATQILAPPTGFVWRASVGRGLARFRGYDLYAAACGRMRWRVLGLPVMRADGPDTSRSALGRLALESVLCPGTLLPRYGVRWRSAGEEGRVVAAFLADGELEEITVQVSPKGAFAYGTIERWGDFGGGGFRRITFGVQALDETTFDGVTIPSEFHAGWFFGTARYAEDGEFFRARITKARFL